MYLLYFKDPSPFFALHPCRRSRHATSYPSSAPVSYLVVVSSQSTSCGKLSDDVPCHATPCRETDAGGPYTGVFLNSQNLVPGRESNQPERNAVQFPVPLSVRNESRILPPRVRPSSLGPPVSPFLGHSALVADVPGNLVRRSNHPPPSPSRQFDGVCLYSIPIARSTPNPCGTIMGRSFLFPSFL